MGKSSPAKLANREKPQKNKSLVSHNYHYSGPLPPPQILNQYDPKTRKTIVSMAQKQSIHRQSIEAKVIHSNVWNERAGMIIAATLTLIMIFGGIFLLMEDKNGVIGLLMIFAPSLFHAGNYIYNKHQENKVQKEKK